LIWLYDPFTMIALIVAYTVGFIALVSIAGFIAPRIARSFAGRFSLQASMLIIGLLVIASGVSGIVLVAYVLASTIGFEFTLDFILGLIVFILIANLITYLISPYVINLSYQARRDDYLQRIVNEASSKLGISNPPKAMIVNSPPNAFAYGNFIAGRYVAVSRELVEILSEDELKAVVGHELGHHKHRDNAIMLLMGVLPSIIYYMGVLLIRMGVVSSYTSRLSSQRRNSSSGGVILVLAGILAVVVSFIVQVLVLAFSRLREYYADTSGAFASSPLSMQRALARLHMYYERNGYAREAVANSKLKALFIYALVEALANPLYYYNTPPRRSIPRDMDIDEVVRELKNKEVSGVQEFFSTHPPTPKRLRFLDTLQM